MGGGGGGVINLGWGAFSILALIESGLIALSESLKCLHAEPKMATQKSTSDLQEVLMAEAAQHLSSPQKGLNAHNPKPNALNNVT